jgi:predicted nucleic acid-binding protein
MTAPAFVDTNVLVYAEDRDAGERHERARRLVLDLWDQRSGVLSVQVLQEFYVTVTRKMARPLSEDAAGAIVEQYLSWSVVENTGPLLQDAIRLSRDARLSFWDALVVCAAQHAGCSVLWTEDLNDGQRFGRLEVRSPFRA